jgi:quinoprotein glucose dehydrogenase
MSTQGAFTPWPLTGNAVTFPSTIGGGNWNGITYDPKLGLIVTNVMNLGQWGHMEKKGDTYVRANAFNVPHARFWNPETHIPCQNPPFGELVAVNANTGDIAWRVPLGETEELAKLGVKDTGSLNLGGSISTASGLVFIAATNDAKFRAFDTKTGKELWSAKLDAPAYATPITFLGKDGKQYVVIVSGGRSFYFATPPGDSISAFALP